LLVSDALTRGVAREKRSCGCDRDTSSLEFLLL
jgi:hypothetical protein